MSIIAKRSRLRKLSKILYDYPDPLRSAEDFERLHNLDLEKMDDLELYKEQQRVWLALAMVDESRILYLAPDGKIITAQSWLLARLAKIRELRGATGYGC